MRPNAVSFVDFQLARYGAPVLDVLYNIFSSTDKAFRMQHYDKLLKSYYDSLSDTIKKLGSDPMKLYTFEQFHMQMQQFGEFSLLFGPLIIQTKMSSPNNVENMDVYAEHLENGNETDLFKEFDEKTQIAYSKLINDLVDDLVGYGYVECK